MPIDENGTARVHDRWGVAASNRWWWWTVVGLNSRQGNYEIRALLILKIISLNVTLICSQVNNLRWYVLQTSHFSKKKLHVYRYLRFYFLQLHFLHFLGRPRVCLATFSASSCVLITSSCSDIFIFWPPCDRDPSWVDTECEPKLSRSCAASGIPPSLLGLFSELSLLVPPWARLWTLCCCFRSSTSSWSAVTASPSTAQKWTVKDSKDWQLFSAEHPIRVFLHFKL